MKNRLQFRHDNTLYDSLSSIRKVLDRSVRTNKERLALYAEPIVFKYGNEDNPNIVLAIGNYGTGEYDSSNNYFLIDTATLESNIVSIKNYLSLNDSDIAEIKDAITSLSTSISKNKSDIATLVKKDTELDSKIASQSTTLTNKINESASYLEDEISTNVSTLNKSIDNVSTTLTKKIDDTNTSLKSNISNVSNNLTTKINEEISGITLTYNRTEQTITLKSKSGQLLGYFGVQDFIKDSMIKSVVLTEDKTNIVIAWNDGSVITIPLKQLITIYTIADSSKSYIKINENKEIAVIIGNESDYNGLASYTQLHNLSDIVGNGFKDTTITSKVNLIENRLITITEISDKTVEDALKLADKVTENSSDIDALENRATKDEAKIASNYSAITALTEEVKDAGKVDDVKVNGKSVVKDKVAVIDFSGVTGKYETDLDDNITTLENIGGIPKGTKVSELTGKTLSDIITDILFPEIYPSVSTKPSIVLSYDSSKNNSVYSIGSQITISKVSASLTGGKFNNPSGYTFSQNTPIFDTKTSFAYSVNSGLEGYEPSASETGITSGTAKIKAGENKVSYNAILEYSAPENKPLTSRGKETTQTGKTDTANSATWVANTTSDAKTITIYGMYPCYTNVSGNELISDASVEVLGKTSNVLEIKNIPSEVDYNENFILEYPSGRDVVFNTNGASGDNTWTEGLDYMISKKASVRTIDGTNYYYDRLETTHDKGEGSHTYYKFTFSTNLYSGAIVKED